MALGTCIFYEIQDHLGREHNYSDTLLLMRDVQPFFSVIDGNYSTSWLM